MSIRKRLHKKQWRINKRLKKTLFGHLIFASCYYCKEVFLTENLTIEHITPLSYNGTNEPDNITLACAPCNHSRGRLSWLSKLRTYKLKNEQYYAKYRK